VIINRWHRLDPGAPSSPPSSSALSIRSAGPFLPELFRMVHDGRARRVRRSRPAPLSSMLILPADGGRTGPCVRKVCFPVDGKVRRALHRPAISWLRALLVFLTLLPVYVVATGQFFSAHRCSPANRHPWRSAAHQASISSWAMAGW